jgi:diaminopimelate epimerase
MKIPFTKMHGLGNDFILIDNRVLHASNLPELSKKLCHRRFGIGADQILLLLDSAKADFGMSIFNADGSEVEMCGNGIRCLAKYIWDRGLSEKDVLEIETPAGIMKPEKRGDMVKVDMGLPIFEPGKIPVSLPVPDQPASGGGIHSDVTEDARHAIVDYPLRIAEREFMITCVSMGNPHAVILVDDLADFDVTYYGPLVEHHALFPKRTNVEFIEVVGPAEIHMRVWERGAGETMACGTGASAVAVASHIKGMTGRSVTVNLPGGKLMIEWQDKNHVYMTGPAVEVFQGIVEG